MPELVVREYIDPPHPLGVHGPRDQDIYFSCPGMEYKSCVVGYKTDRATPPQYKIFWQTDINASDAFRVLRNFTYGYKRGMLWVIQGDGQEDLRYSLGFTQELYEEDERGIITNLTYTSAHSEGLGSATIIRACVETEIDAEDGPNLVWDRRPPPSLAPAIRHNAMSIIHTGTMVLTPYLAEVIDSTAPPEARDFLNNNIPVVAPALDHFMALPFGECSLPQGFSERPSL